MYVRDGRALMGGAALIITGVILTSMLRFYFAGEYTGQGVVRARWWWEIVINLQILSGALMWFCYVERMAEAKGTMKQVMRLRMAFGLSVVFLPIWLALLSAYLNWFVVRPPIEIIDLMMCGMLGFWALSVFLPRFLILKSESGPVAKAPFFSIKKPKAWYSLMPVYALVGIWVVGVIEDSVIHYHYAPLMLYFQAAVPYIERGLSNKNPAKIAS